MQQLMSFIFLFLLNSVDSATQELHVVAAWLSQKSSEPRDISVPQKFTRHCHKAPLHKSIPFSTWCQVITETHIKFFHCNSKRGEGFMCFLEPQTGERRMILIKRLLLLQICLVWEEDL